MTKGQHKHSFCSSDLLGTQGYEGIIKGIGAGPLSKYNGTRCQPVQLGIEDKWLVKLPDRGDEVVLALKNFDVVMTAAHARGMQGWEEETAVAGGVSSSIGLNNRSSAPVAIESLCVEIMQALRRLPEEGERISVAERIAKVFDVNRDRVVDRSELTAGCKELGVIVSEQQLNLVWPLFNPDPETQEVDIADFAGAIAQRVKAKRNPLSVNREAAQRMHEQTMSTGQAQRKKRIKQKSAHFDALCKISLQLIELLQGLMEAKDCTPETLFHEMDEDGGGSLDMSEFRGFLKGNSKPFSKDKMEAIWPLICGSATGEMDMADFKKLVSRDKASGLDPKLLQDRFTNSIQIPELRGAWTSARVPRKRMVEMLPRARPPRLPSLVAVELKKDRDKAKKVSSRLVKLGRVRNGRIVLYRRQSIERGYVFEAIGKTGE